LSSPEVRCRNQPLLPFRPFDGEHGPAAASIAVHQFAKPVDPGKLDHVTNRAAWCNAKPHLNGRFRQTTSAARL
jgi:hypothetical protein